MGFELRATELRKIYGERKILDGMDLSCQSGTSTAIVGPSGSGKSTLLNVLGSLDKPDSGVITLGETDVLRLEGKSLSGYRSKQVGFVFQEHHLLPQLTAWENVLVPTLAAGATGNKAKALELLAQVGVDGRAEAFPAQLSGGERQRVAIARALVNGPSLLLCDEPTGNLDHETGLAVLKLLLERAAQAEVIVVAVTHNMEFARLFDRVLLLENGRLTDGSPA